MSELLNGFNNGRDTTEGVGGQKPINDIANGVTTGEGQLTIPDVRHSADMWWKTLTHETKVNYATEHLNKRGQVFRYNNDGLISGFTLSDVVELLRHYA